ncbi:hypothetical protein [Desulfobacterium sp. N47]|uniref:Lipoprotein n=1 Tax=uncultured Desulfobacterium sp. TaxID=201089 RepID=E1YIE1_9BACT|nr:unknown protein [uncultured Desulfobacterium sp.]
MQKLHRKKAFLKLFIYLQLPFLLLSCMVNTRSVQDPVQNKDKWQLFTEIKKGQYLLLIDTVNVSRLSDGTLKCSAKIVPSPKRAGTLKKTIISANREAGIERKNEDQIVNGIIKSETELHDCEISCKTNKLYLYVTKQNILEFPVSESGPDHELFKRVCESSK